MNVLNFFDRQLLSAGAPLIKGDFHLSNAQYGEIIALFSFVYASMALFAGALLDRIGLTATVTAAVFTWSVGSAATGLTYTFEGLLLSRMILGLGEAAALPCLSKASAIYLPSSEWGLANVVGSITVTAGIAAAPLVESVMAPRYGWRSAFVLAGALGLAWTGLWRLTSGIIRPGTGPGPMPRSPITRMLGDRRLWGTAACYALVMALYLFWLNWTTIYLVQERHFTAAEANRYFAWIPSLFAVLGGMLSGGLAFRWIRAGADPVAARMRICWLSAPMALVTALVPWLPSTRLAVAAIGLSLLFCMSAVTSLNVIPVDLFGPRNAGFTTSVLAFSYALMQTFVSPLIGKVVDRAGFAAVCVALSVFPLIGTCVLWRFRCQAPVSVAVQAIPEPTTI